MLTLVGICAAGLAAVCCAPSPTVHATQTPTVAPTHTATGASPPVPPTPTLAPALPGGEDVFKDPVVEEIYHQARRDLVDRLDAAVEDVELVEWTALVWPDTSLGCPQPDREYDPVEVPGYRLLFRVDGEVYPYHADFIVAVLCAAEDEVLPE